MSYYAVCIYTPDGDFKGYGISGPNKLQSLNIYAEGEEEELNEQIGRLNEDIDLKSHWPHPQDPEVVALLADESFMPLTYKEAEVVDDENSYYVYTKDEAIDEEASVIVFKKAKVPERPTDMILRIKAACEQVARQRASTSV